MKKYLSYILLGIMMAFALFFMVLFGMNMYMSKSTINFVPNDEYEAKLEYLENVLKDNDDNCKSSLNLYLNYSKDTYFSSKITPYEWINKIMYRNTTVEEYIQNIADECELDERMRKELVNSYSLVSYTIDRITNDAINNYKLSFGDVFTSYIIDKDISVYNYRVAKIEEMHIIERVLNGMEGYNE